MAHIAIYCIMLIVGGYADTYYVYDGYGDLRYVVPPELSERISDKDGEWDTNDDGVWDYAFVYRYDGRGHCVYRKLPGCEPVVTGYDKGGKPVLEQDGNQRERGEWTLRLYDRQCREAVRAVVRGTDGDMFRDGVLRGEYTGDVSPGLGGYTANLALPEIVSLVVVNYYDGHGFADLEADSLRSRYGQRAEDGYGEAYGDHTGRLTGMRSYLQDGSGDYLLSAYYYDYDGNVVESHSSNHLGGMDDIYALYDLAGKPLKSLAVHSGDGGDEMRIERSYGYDHAGRLAKVTHRIGGGETRVLLKNSYDGVGRLAVVETNGGSYRTDYGYNVRGWLTEIVSPLMEQTLNYTEHSLRRNPYMNGNINSITTKNNLLSPATGELMGSGKATVTYMYDKLNRLESSTYEPEGRPSNPGTYNTAYTYDLNGNITMLSRQGVNERLTDDGEVVYAGYGFTDQITATYDGNRLLKVKDNMEEVVYGDAFDFRDGADEDVEYEYDSNGNMTADLNCGIKEITYDVNNRPLSVTFSTRPAEQRTKYLYDASGRKLRTTYQTSRFAILDPGFRVDTIITDIGILGGLGTGVLCPLSSPGIGGTVERWDDGKVQPAENMLWSTNFIRDYCGDIIYKDGEIERILTDNGYAVPDSAGGYDYYYYVKDWQGNVRAVIDEANRRMELNNYYPYGMPMSSTASVQPYKYGGKELDRTNGLDMYDFEARHYDPIVPRFTTIDPMAEKNSSVSPYSYCGGNPINRVDPTGMDEWEINKRGEIVNRIKTKEHDAFYIVNKNKDGIYEREYSVDNKGNKKYNSISFKYGTIESQRSISYSKGDSYDIYQVRGDISGENLFTFLSDNISVKPEQVEFTLVQSGLKGYNGLNFITTGHMRGSEPGFKYLFEGQLVNGYILRNIIHSHPVGKNAGRNDVLQIGNIRDNLQPRGIPMPLFFIYHVPTKSYKQYND